LAEASASSLLGTLLPPLAGLAKAQIWQTTAAALTDALQPPGSPKELPTTAFIPLALEAARQVFGGETVGLEDLRCERPLPLDDPRRHVQVTIHRQSDALAEFSIDSLSDGRAAQTNGTPPRWDRHASGRLVRWPEKAPPAPSSPRLAVGSH
jgi:hypothetical protein